VKKLKGKRMEGYKEVRTHLPGIKRLFVLPAVVLVQSCLGGLYAWSAFAPALQKDFGYTAGQTQLIFGLSVAAFTLSMVFAGRLLQPWGARRVAFLSGLLFAAGYLTSAVSAGKFLYVLAGSGLLVGTSIGFGYVASLTTAIQWYPTHKGLVAGAAVAGFGAGAILLSSLIAALLHDGFTVQDLLLVVGFGYGAVICSGAVFLFRPPSAPAPLKHVPLNLLLQDRLFRKLATGIFCGTFAGLLVIGNLKPLAMDCGVSSSTATAAISFFAVGNAAGRLAWGWFFDHFGYPVIPASLLFLCGALTLLLVARFEPSIFSVCALGVGFGFGACFVLYAAQVALRYGADHVASIYPLIFIANGVAGLTGPPMGGFLYDVTGSYAWPLVAAIAVLALGAWSTFTNSDNPKLIDSC
jgi:MFS transporter, OFA family, oxalate/formate antiporter